MNKKAAPGTHLKRILKFGMGTQVQICGLDHSDFQSFNYVHTHIINPNFLYP